MYFWLKKVMTMQVWLVLLGCWLFLNGTISAQTVGAGLQGTITDSTGTAISKAKVVAYNTGTSAIHEVESNSIGYYNLPLLPSGDYEIQVSAPSFQATINKGLRLTVGQNAVVDFVLSVNETVGEMLVTTGNESIDTTSAVLSGLVTQDQIRNLPLNGRSFEQLALLQPGVSAALTAGNDVVGGRTPKISINGARPEQNNFLLDGTDINNIYNKTPGSVAGVLLGVEAVLEFRVLTNAYSAEYGRASGGIVNAVTRSGTNNLHGSIFYFHRNSVLDAKNYFDKPQQPIPPFKRNQFGGVVGGPIRKDKTFFFAVYEGLSERLGITGVTNVPDLKARQGILPGRPAITLHSAIPAYLQTLFPLPNGRTLPGGAAEYLFSVSQPLDERFIQGRIDHYFSDRNSLFGRYTISNGNVDRQPFNKPPIAFTKERSRNQYFTLEQQFIFSPTLLNVLHIGFSRSIQESDNKRTIDIPPSLSFVPGEPFGFITIAGLVSDLGGDFRIPRFDRLNSYQLGDTVLLTRGRHVLSFGFQLQRIQYNQFFNGQRGGIVTFDNLEDFLRGSPRSAEVAMTSLVDPARGFRQWLAGLFIQDNFKVKKNLSLNLGLRYEFASVPTEVNNKISGLRTVTDSKITVGESLYSNPSLRNFAPRVGLAWDPFGDGKTSIRAGFGLFFDEILPKYYFIAATLNPPFATRTTIVRTPTNPVPFPNVIANFNPNTPVRPLLQTINFDLENPYTIQYNLSIQRALPGNWSLTLGYAGSRGNHLLRVAEANLAPESIVNGVKVYHPERGRRNPNFTGIFQRVSDAQSFYNALQVSLLKQSSYGLSTQVSYTFSRSVDDSSGINSQDFNNVIQYGLDFYDRSADRGLSAFHVKHNFTFNSTYDLPFGRTMKGVIGALVRGWQINNITTIRSGHPFTVRMGFNRSGNLNTISFGANERPNIKAGVNPVLGGPDRYLNPAAFELPPANQRGNLGRNTFIGPGLVAVDLSIVKAFKLSEQKRLLFRAEIFNLPNHPNFSVPSGQILFTSPTATIAPNFGRITSTVTTSRQIQFGMKYEF
ncbi:MAG: TonB-dependent receptor [Acidobacteriota bacterium]